METVQYDKVESGKTTEDVVEPARDVTKKTKWSFFRRVKWGWVFRCIIIVFLLSGLSVYILTRIYHIPPKLVYHRLQRPLLICGILSSLLYVAMNIVVAALYPGYNSASQTVSELSAIGTPTRPIWLPLGIVYTLLLSAFGWGLRIVAQENRPLRVVGWLFFIYGISGVFWPPMHQREVLAAEGGSLTDTMHIVFSIVSAVFAILAIGFGAGAFGKRFRMYSIGSIVILLAFGVLTGLDAPRMQANLPTPLIGVWERINIGVYLLWVIVLAVVVLKKEKVDMGLINTDKNRIH